jgi:hypothetical protein
MSAPTGGGPLSRRAMWAYVALVVVVSGFIGWVLAVVP